jgi:hypothetical protein
MSSILELLKTANQRVLYLLRNAMLQNKPYWKAIPESAGFLPAYEFQKVEIGGSSGMRRLRQLREERNVPIIHKQFKVPNQKRTVHAYRLDCGRGDIALTDLYMNWKDWKFNK